MEWSEGESSAVESVKLQTAVGWGTGILER